MRIKSEAFIKPHSKVDSNMYIPFQQWTALCYTKTNSKKVLFPNHQDRQSGVCKDIFQTNSISIKSNFQTDSIQEININSVLQ